MVRSPPPPIHQWYRSGQIGRLVRLIDCNQGRKINAKTVELGVEIKATNSYFSQYWKVWAVVVFIVGRQIWSKLEIKTANCRHRCPNPREQKMFSVRGKPLKIRKVWAVLLLIQTYVFWILSNLMRHFLSCVAAVKKIVNRPQNVRQSEILTKLF